MNCRTPCAARQPAPGAQVGGGRPRLRQPRLSAAYLGPGRAARDPAQAQRSAGGLPRLHLQQQEPRRAPLGQIKEWRAVATRYEKTACSFMGVLCMAAAMDWLKS